MIRSWVVYILLLTIDMLLWLTIDGYVYYFVFRVLLLLPFISLALFIIGKHKLTFELKMQEDHVLISITSKLPSSLCSQVILNGEWENVFHGIKKSTEKTFYEDVLQLNKPNLGSGYYIFRIQSIQCYDLLHLFRYRIKCNNEIESYQLPIPVNLKENVLQILQSKIEKTRDEEMDTDYEIKEYIEGEIPTHIHYQSSNRLQKLMLKKYNLMQNSCIQIHVCFPEDIQECELILSVCVELCKKAVEHNSIDLFWQDMEGNHYLKNLCKADINKFLFICLAKPKYIGYPMKKEGVIYLDSTLCHYLTQEVIV